MENNNYTLGGDPSSVGQQQAAQFQPNISAIGNQGLLNIALPSNANVNNLA